MGNKHHHWFWWGIGIAVVLLAAGALTYRQRRIDAQKVVVQENQRYTADMRQAQRAARYEEWAASLRALSHAQAIHATAQIQEMINRVESLQGHYIGAEIETGGSKNVVAYIVRVTPGGPAAKAGIHPGDTLLGGAFQRKSVFNNIAANFYSVLDLKALLDSAKIGQTVFFQVQTPHKTQVIIPVRVGGMPSGMGWTIGFYQNSRFGVGIQLPTLYDHGIPFGWEPISTAGSDYSGRTFLDPLDPEVSIAVYGMNNVLASSLSSNLPASASVINSQLNVGNYPGELYKDTTQTRGVTVINEGVVVGGASYASMNGVQITVPQSQWSRWQPIINQLINSFIPGDLTQSH